MSNYNYVVLIIEDYHEIVKLCTWPGVLLTLFKHTYSMDMLLCNNGMQICIYQYTSLYMYQKIKELENKAKL